MASLDDVCNELIEISNSVKKESNKFLKEQAKILKKRTLDTARKRVKKRTGNYLRGIKEGKPYTFEGRYSCRVYSSARHAHLIEYGHDIKKEKNGAVIGKVEGKSVFTDTASEFVEEFEENSQEMLEEMFKKRGF